MDNGSGSGTKEVNILDTKILQEKAVETTSTTVYSDWGTKIGMFDNEITVPQFRRFLRECLYASGITSVSDYWEYGMTGYQNYWYVRMGVTFEIEGYTYKWFFSYSPQVNPPVYNVCPIAWNVEAKEENFVIIPSTGTKVGNTVKFAFDINGKEREINPNIFSSESSGNGTTRFVYEAVKPLNYETKNIFWWFGVPHFRTENFFCRVSGDYSGFHYYNDSENSLKDNIPMAGKGTYYSINSLCMAFSPIGYTEEELAKIGYSKIIGNYGATTKELKEFFYTPIRASVGNLAVLVDIQDETKYCYICHNGNSAISCIADGGTMF